MIIIRLDSFLKDFKKLSKHLKKQAEKQLRLFIQDPYYPSLQTHKMNDSRNIWEARVTDSYRFTFQQKGEVYILRRIGSHDIIKNP